MNSLPPLISLTPVEVKMMVMKWVKERQKRERLSVAIVGFSIGLSRFLSVFLAATIMQLLVTRSLVFEKQERVKCEGLMMVMGKKKMVWFEMKKEKFVLK